MLAEDAREMKIVNRILLFSCLVMLLKGGGMDAVLVRLLSVYVLAGIGGIVGIGMCLLLVKICSIELGPFQTVFVKVYALFFLAMTITLLAGSLQQEMGWTVYIFFIIVTVCLPIFMFGMLILFESIGYVESFYAAMLMMLCLFTLSSFLLKV